MRNNRQYRGHGMSLYAALLFLHHVRWSVDACQLFRRRSDNIVDWWVCTSCSSKLECCQLHYESNALDYRIEQKQYCNEAIAQVPIMPRQEEKLAFTYSLFWDASYDTMRNDGDYSFQWEKLQSDTGTWKTISHHPFRGNDDSNIVSSSLQSDVSKNGGMHRLWNFRLSIGSEQRKQSKVRTTILVFLTSNVFVDVEDWMDGEPKNDSTMIQLQTESLIDIEAPSIYSPQHALVIDVSLGGNHTENNDSNLEFKMQLHLRYLTPSNTTTSAVLLPPPLIWNSNHVSEQQRPLVLEASRARANDFWMAWIGTLVCSIVSSFILIKDIAKTCRWN
mmetsp:Transcript_31632/g.47802  ORF Transcript_31632/g.47802 Transcript_31632/m.47802 type:complete len:333 (+) Transcript_31632:119-1117(+)